MSNIEQLAKAEQTAYENYMMVKDECASKMAEISGQWIDAQSALAKARNYEAHLKLCESIRAELAMQPAEGRVAK